MRGLPISEEQAYSSNVLDSTILEPVDLASDAALLTAVADPIRLGLLHQLAAAEQRCVCDLQTDPPIPGNLLSYHLKVLRDAGLVTSSRRGRWVDYALTPDALDRIHAAIPLPGHVDDCGRCQR